MTVEAPYLIVGGGMAGHAAALALRAQDGSRPIALIGAEPTGPYKRPPLSKGLWRDEPLETVWLDTRIPGLELHLGRRVSAIDRAERKVVDDQGKEHRYHKLLLATGGSPRRLPFGGDRVTYFRTLEDYRRLRAAADTGASVVVVGGGFIGSEIAAALAMNGLEPVLVFPEETIGARVFPPDLGRHLNAMYREKGVRVLAGERVVGIEGRGARTAVLTAAGAALEGDAVVAGLGIVPGTELAEGAGLAIDNGIVVDQGLRTSDPSIYAAGDVARFPSPQLGTSIRVEHEDAAVSMGTAAGAAMAGAAGPYGHLPFFYSDLFDLGYEAVGITDSRLEVVSDWTDPYRRGFLYYLAEGRVRGVVCWGVFGKLREARALIAEPGPFRAADLRGRILP
jgi:NADPH-dependent 2,4-dienoyl-CoA reductase/sulfur reductase-like enzyme